MHCINHVSFLSSLFVDFETNLWNIAHILRAASSFWALLVPEQTGFSP